MSLLTRSAPPEAYARDPAARSRPSVANNLALGKQRGRRECRVMTSPMARLQQKSRRQSGRPDQPAFPARWFTPYIALSPVSFAWLPPSSLRSLLLKNLAPASERQDHTTSPSASATFVSRAIRVHRIPAPRIVTIGRNVPLHRGGMRESIVVICPTEQALTPATDWHDGQFAHGMHAEIARRASMCTRTIGSERVSPPQQAARASTAGSGKPYSLQTTTHFERN
jgi:hypothetical protein